MMATGLRQERVISRVEGTRRGQGGGRGVAAIVPWARAVTCRLTWHNKKWFTRGRSLYGAVLGA